MVEAEAMKLIASLLLIVAALTLSGCDEQTTERILRGSAGAIDGYYSRPAYYAPAPVVAPVAPVYPVTY